jgi:hypothetical protein
MRHGSSTLVRAGVVGFCLLVSSTLSDAQTPVATTGIRDPARVLWTDPGSIAARDLFWGPGSEARTPKPPFTFVEEDSSGTQPKIVVRDSSGSTWVVKFGAEARAEVAANRIVHALGYAAEENYFVHAGKIDNVSDLKRASSHVTPSGVFLEARFTLKDPAIVVTNEEWTFHESPFAGRQELSGLLILMTMLNNWDIRGAANNDVVRVTLPDGRQELRYLVADLGATFGRMGGRISQHSKWNLADYKVEGFIEKVEGGVVHLDYDGVDSKMDRVPVEHARWFASIVSQLTEPQVRRAFEAAQAKPEEIEGFAKRFVEKIGELQAAVR